MAIDVEIEYLRVSFACRFGCFFKDFFKFSIWYQADKLTFFDGPTAG